MGLLLFLVLVWLANAFVAMMVLEEHDKSGLGFFWGFFFGPLGVLISVITATNLDREKSDRETRDLLRQELATREQMVERAVVAALAVHGGGSAQPANISTPQAATPDQPRARTYGEIVAPDPERLPRRFR